MNSVVSPKESLDSKPSTSSLVLNDVKLGKPKQENVEEVAKAKKEGPVSEGGFGKVCADI